MCSRPQGRVQASWLAAAGSWESSRPRTATTVGGSLVEGAGGGIGRCAEPRKKAALSSRVRCHIHIVSDDQVTGENRRAGAPKHRQRFLSVRPGGWSRTPVNSSGTRLINAHSRRRPNGSLRPVITPYPFPSNYYISMLYACCIYGAPGGIETMNMLMQSSSFIVCVWHKKVGL